jgi:hypothetical protein
VPYADPGVAVTASRVAVGCRVVLSSSGLFGTVRFAGNTAFQSGLWVGVELDGQEGGHKPQVVRGMLSRGKNDGTVKGQRYFTCPENHVRVRVRIWVLSLRLNRAACSCQGIFVRPTSFEVISYPGVYPGDGLEVLEPAGATRSATRVKSAAVSDSDESSTDAFKPTTYASSVASNAMLSQPDAPAGANRRSSQDVYGALYGDSEPPSPDRHSTSSPRTFEPQTSSQQARRLSPRRRTSALVSSIDDVLASMEYAASDINRASKEKKDASGPCSLLLRRWRLLLASSVGPFSVITAFKAAPVRPKVAASKAYARPKSPFERRTQAASVYSSEEERLFVENLVELVGTE